jgi:HK97 family phage major capsid protein
MAGIETNRTSITLPAEVSAEIIAAAQEESAVMRLARRINLPGRGLTIPVISGDPEANWVDETTAKPVSNPILTTKNMKGYTLAVIVPFSNQFRRDMAGLYAEIVRRLPGALGKKFDATVFAGTAPGTGFDVLTGVTAQSISGTGNSFYKALVAAESAIATAGFSVSGYAMSPQGRAEMLTALDTTNRPIFINSVADGEVGRLLGQPVHYTKGVYAAGSGSGAVDVLGFAGDWSKAMYGIVEGVDISISDQATLTTSGGTINLWQQNMFAVRAEIEVGFVAQATAFNKITRAHSA